MASVAGPGLNPAQLVGLVPSKSWGERNPYYGFAPARLRRGVESQTLESASGTSRANLDWRAALASQFATGFRNPDFDAEIPWGAAAQRRAAQAGVRLEAMDGYPGPWKALSQIGLIASETLAAAMVVGPAPYPGAPGACRVQDMRTLLVPADTHRGKPPTLLVLDPHLAGPPLRITDRIGIEPDGFLQAYARLREDGAWWHNAAGLHALLEQTGPGGLLSALWIAQPEVIVARKPVMMPLACPDPAHEVFAGAQRSSLGTFCRDAAGVAGFTACFHGTGPAGTAITLGGRQTVVTHANAVQDIVFAPLPDNYPFPNLLLGGGGIRRTRAPAQSDPARFCGCTSGPQATVVVSHDAGLLRTRASVQLKVQTTAVLNHGDSGSALVDENDQIMAFAFERTAIDEPIQFADWIWAANAFDALDLRY